MGEGMLRMPEPGEPKVFENPWHVMINVDNGGTNAGR
jgi:hypothetical protein